MAKKTTRQRLVARLDDMTGKIVKWRDGPICYCGSSDRIQWGHLIGRKHYGVRWELLNSFSQCQACNYAHNLPQYTWRMYKFFEWRFGKDTLSKLLSVADKSANRLADAKTPELEELLEQRNELLAVAKTTRVHSDLDLRDLGFYGTIDFSFKSEQHQMPTWMMMKGA